MRFRQTGETVTLFEATLIFDRKLARVDILRKQGNELELIEVKAKLVDSSDEAHPFRGARGNITADWR